MADTELQQLVVWVGTTEKIQYAMAQGLITENDFAITTDAPEFQTKLTSANAGTGISITEVGGVVKISNTQTSAEWGNILGNLPDQADLWGYLSDILSDISDIQSLIPAQASSSNQLADKAFVNSTTQTATANFRGNWTTWAAVPTNAEDYPLDYAQSRTPTVNDYLVVQDASGYTGETLTGTWRFKYSGEWSVNGKNGWHPEYQVNETPLTAAQLAALNSGATEAKINQITTNKNAIGTLSNLTTTDKSSLVGALNELNNTKQDNINDLQQIRDGAAAGASAVQPNQLGTAAYEDANSFATASQGAKADTAIQQADLDTALSTKIDKGYAVNDFATNCITEIPQDIKLELNNGTLTLKAGSVITLPDGTQIQTTVDKTTTSTTSGKILIVPTPSGGVITSNLNVSKCVSGTTDSLAGEPLHLWYDTANNVINYYGSDGSTPSGTRALPIAICTVSNGAITSIDQIFNGAGYIGHHVFALPGVVVLRGNGIDQNGNLSVVKIKRTTLAIGEMATTNSVLTVTNETVVQRRSGYKEVFSVDMDYTGLQYIIPQNISIYNKTYIRNEVPLAFYKYNGTSVTSFEMAAVSGLSASYINTALGYTPERIATIQTLSATDSITLADNTIYNGGEQTALTIALPATVDVSFLCEIDFTSGATPATLAYPNTIKWIGDDVANNVFIPVASKRYTIICAYDGVNYRFTVKGV